MVLAANGLFAGGGIIGALIISPSLNKLGRRLSIQIICTVCIVSAAIQGGSVHIAMVSTLTAPIQTLKAELIYAT